MREILFRGKKVNNGEWIYGYLIYIAEKPYIFQVLGVVASWTEVVPKTIGQYTGLTDKNGAKIFEGDIAIADADREEICVIEWDDDTARFTIDFDSVCADFDNFYSYDLEVIGNIHDNSELLEGSKKE